MGLIRSADAAQRLGVSTAYLRGQAKNGRWGAVKPVGERSWFFDEDDIEAAAANRTQPAAPVVAQPTTAPAPHLDDASSFALERQLLIAQAAAETARADRAELQAQIDVRDQRILGQDQTIAALQAELGRLRQRERRLAAYVEADLVAE